MPPNGAIPEAGNQPIALNRGRLPMAVLRTRGPMEVQDGQPGTAGASAQSLYEHLTVSCWLLQPTTAGENDVETIRDRLLQLCIALYADRRMGGTVTRSRVSEVNWSGIGEAPPFEAESGIGVQTGYVTVELEIIDV